MTCTEERLGSDLPKVVLFGPYALLLLQAASATNRCMGLCLGVLFTLSNVHAHSKVPLTYTEFGVAPQRAVREVRLNFNDLIF